MVIDDGKSLISSMKGVKFSFVRRFTNSVAHTLAKVCTTLIEPVVWRFSPTHSILNILSSDIQ